MLLICGSNAQRIEDRCASSTLIAFAEVLYRSSYTIKQTH